MALGSINYNFVGDSDHSSRPRFLNPDHHTDPGFFLNNSLFTIVIPTDSQEYNMTNPWWGYALY